MKDYETKSYWLESAGPYYEKDPLTDHIQADICIIGAGFTGLSTAIHLKEKDPSLRVVVLESSVAGVGASGRNAGFSMRLFGITMELTKMRYGKKKTKEADAYMVDAVNYLEDIINKYQIDCDYIRDGMITVATNPHQLKQLEKEMKIAEDIGLKNLKWLDQKETQSLVHSPTYLGSRYDNTCALLQPAKLARGLALTAEKLGVKIYERTEVQDVDLALSIVTTAGASVRAGKILFAANAYSGFFKKLNKKQLPIYTYITLTEPLSPEQQEQLGWMQRVGIEDARNYLHYYRLTPDNRLLMGGSDALYYYGGGLNRDKNEVLNKRLQQHVLETFPQLKGVRFTHHWGGPISASLDLVPVIGKLAPNAWYSMGCIGHGVSLTNYNGLTLSELLLGEQSKRTEFFIVNRRITSIPPEPLRYITAGAIRKYLQYEDNKGLKK